MGDKPGIQGRGLWQAPFKGKDKGMGQIKAAGIKRIRPIRSLRIKRHEGNPILALMRGQKRLIKGHSRAATIWLATQW